MRAQFIHSMVLAVIIALSSLARAESIPSVNQEDRRLTPVGTDNPKAYNAFVKGWESYRTRSVDKLVEAIEYLELAIAFDPSYLQARAALAAAYWAIVQDCYQPPLEIGKREAELRASVHFARAYDVAPVALVHQASAAFRVSLNLHDDAIAEAKRAVALDQHDPESHIALARALILTGQPQKAVVHIERALELDARSSKYYIALLGWAYFGMEKYERAASTLEEAIDFDSGPELPMKILLATYGHLGRRGDAQSLLMRLNEMRSQVSCHPHGFQIKETHSFANYKDETDKSRLDNGLRKAGVPEDYLHVLLRQNTE